MTDSCAFVHTNEVLPDSILFNNYPANPALKISIILPVRNEEDNLIKALDAIKLQFNGLGKRVLYQEYEVLLLANNCTDRSVEIARNYQKRNRGFALHLEEITLDPEVAHIGTVRRLLMDAAYARFNQLGKPEGVIASTDSDSEVDKFWIYQTLQEINNGNDVVGGRILTKPDRSIARLYYLRDITYKHLVSKLEDLLDPIHNDRWPRHFQCFGASFAVTSRIYDLSGRLPVIPFLEDMAFHRSLIRVDAKIRLSPLVQVLTSARIQGRVDFGLSIQLKQWGEMNASRHPLMVEPVGSLTVKLKAKKLLREFWAKSGADFQILPTMTSLLDIDQNWLLDEVQSSTYFGTLWERVEEKLNQQEWSKTWPLMNVVEVIPELKMEISRLTASLAKYDF